MRKLLSVTEAAERAGVRPDTLRRWSDAGRIPFTRWPNGYRMYRPEDVDALRVQLYGAEEPQPEPVPA